MTFSRQDAIDYLFTETKMDKINFRDYPNYMIVRDARLCVKYVIIHEVKLIVVGQESEINENTGIPEISIPVSIGE